MSQEWWVCTYCYRSNHPLWSKCQTCRAPRSQPAGYAAAPRADDADDRSGGVSSGTAKEAPEAAARPSARPDTVETVATVETASSAEHVSTDRRGAASKRSRRKAAHNGDAPDNACPRCAQEMEAEWNHCPRCGWARAAAKAPEIKLVPLPPPSGRPLRRLGMVQPVADLVESNGHYESEENGHHEPEE